MRTEWWAARVTVGRPGVVDPGLLRRLLLTIGVWVRLFPGGDHEASRPIWQANRVDFNGRTGFLRIARKMNTPIVPMGIRGSHYSVPILWRSTWLLPRLFVLPALFGLKRYPLTALSVAGAAAIVCLAQPALGWAAAAGLSYLWMASPYVFLPCVPSTIRLRVGDAIPPEALFDDEEKSLEIAYARVVAEVQALVAAPVSPRRPR